MLKEGFFLFSDMGKTLSCMIYEGMSQWKARLNMEKRSGGGLMETCPEKARRSQSLVQSWGGEERTEAPRRFRVGTLSRGSELVGRWGGSKVVG